MCDELETLLAHSIRESNYLPRTSYITPLQPKPHTAHEDGTDGVVATNHS